MKIKITHKVKRGTSHRTRTEQLHLIQTMNKVFVNKFYEFFHITPLIKKH